MTAVAQERCPECGADVPVNEGYVTWCHECGWNLALPAADEPKRRIDRLYDRVGRRLGERMVGELLAVERLEPRPTPARVAAYAIAVLVYVLTLGLLAGGIALAVLTYPNPVTIVLGLLMAATGLLMRPRLGKLPKEGLVRRDEAPSLYELGDRVAAALGIRGVDVVVVDRDFNASWAVLGARRRRVLTVGLPLLAVLEPQERVALVAHELAHARNGDSTRGLLVGSAVEGLASLYWLVSHEDQGESEGGPLVDLLAKTLLFVVSRPVWLLLMLQLHLVLRDQQRGEYLADALAARVAGTEAVVSMHVKLLLQHTIWATLQHAAGPSGREGDDDVFGDVARAVLSVPERERERRRRLAMLEGAKLGATHPPTGKRIELLEGREPQRPQVELAADASAAIDAELSSRSRSEGRQLLEEYREAIYG